jgi:2-C-methyl-D-erythritol 2,4-cyclodiphosphate synthase
MPNRRATSIVLRVGWGYDIHRLTPGYRLVLGGVMFPDSPAGFDTHSDGDVVAHALIDALCGALADGSLGQYFPEDAPEDQDARSIEFLGRFLPVLQRHRAEVQNVDCTVFVRDAKITSVAEEMRRNIADQLGIPMTAVSVKGKNKDGFSPEGTGEAASATAVAFVLVRDNLAVDG